MTSKPAEDALMPAGWLYTLTFEDGEGQTEYSAERLSVEQRTSPFGIQGDGHGGTVTEYQVYRTAANAAAAPAEVSEAEVEAALEEIEEALNRLEGWGKAYPLDIFPEPTAEQREKLRREMPGMQDRIAASMGRHCAACISDDLTKIRKALESLPPAPGGVE